MDIVRLATTLAVAGLLVGGVVSGCGSGAEESGSNGSQVSVDVYAASSLTDVYTEFEQRFEDANPEIDIRLNLAGSSTLARQINDGAPADIFAPADISILDQLVDVIEVPAEDAKPYATNRLVLVVPTGNPRSITQPSQLEQPDVLTAKCITGVPCGDAADEGLAQADVEVGLVTEETNVRSVLAKVAAGEVDAGLVYQTDAKVTSEVEVIEGFESPEVQLVVIGLNQNSSESLSADAGPSNQASNQAVSKFVTYVRSEQASAILADAGFGKP